MSSTTTDSYHERQDRYRASIALRRQILIAAMGGCCQSCGTEGDESNGLEFDHIERRTWIASNKSRWSRQGTYEREWAEGKLQLLCAACNKKRGQPDDPDDMPF